METDKIKKILERRKDKKYGAYIFNRLANAKNPKVYLPILIDEGDFHPKNNPKPIEDKERKGSFSIPRWDILGFLENVSKHNKENPDKEITKLILQIIKGYITYQSDQKKKVDNYITDWYIFKVIFNLPVDKILNEHIGYLIIALNGKWDTTLIQSDIGKTFLPYLLDNNAKNIILRLLEIIFNFYEKKDVGQDEYWFDELLKKNKERIIGYYKDDLYGRIINKIEEIVKKDKSSFNIVWIPTIEEHPQTSFPQRYECQLVRLLRDTLKEIHKDKLSKIIKSLFLKEHSIFKRIAVHVIDIYYDELREFFWDLKDNPLENYELTHEIHKLLSDNSNKFNKNEINKVISWIETKKYYIPDDVKGNQNKENEIIAYRKKEWYLALKDLPNKNIKEKYDAYEKINPSKVKHPGFQTWSETSWGHKTPKNFPIILTKDNKKIAKYLKEFKGSKDPTQENEEGLADELSRAVLNNPTKFSEELFPFLSVNEIYQHSIIRGFRDAWRKEKEFGLGGFFNFSKKLLELENFWKKEYKENGFNYRDWIISEVASLIEDGAKKEKHSFDDSLNDSAKTILFNLAKKTTTPLFKSTDIISDVLNSVKGSIYSALMVLSLKIARIKKDDTNKWDKDIQNLFMEQLKNPSEELLVVLGENLLLINYMDNEWFKNNLNTILIKETEELWNLAMTGYLDYTTQLDKTVYSLLVERGDYEKAIYTNLKNKSANERVVQHICVAYINDMENLSEGLLCTLLDNKNPNQISEIIRFFWTLRREKLDKKKKSKIKPLWGKLFEICVEKKENKEFSELIFKLSEWLSLVDDIDEGLFTILKESVKHVKQPYDTWFFIEYLMKHVKNTPEYVGTIFLELLNNGILPDYKQEHIFNIISVLFEKKQDELADKIISVYLSENYFTKELRDLKKKYEK